MGSGKRLRVEATGFPGTTKTLKFLQEAFSEPLEALAKLMGNDLVILSGCEIDGGYANPGYMAYRGAIYRFEGGTVPPIQALGIKNKIDLVEYDDGSLSELPGYETETIVFRTGDMLGIGYLNTAVRLKTMQQLSELQLPDDVVRDATYIKLTQAMINYWNSIVGNIQADWSEADEADGAFIKDKPFQKIKVTSGTLNMLHPLSGNPPGQLNYNVAYVPPPAGFTTADLAGFIPSLARIRYTGTVDNNDTTWCDWVIWPFLPDLVTISFGNTEFNPDVLPRVNFLAIWMK